MNINTLPAKKITLATVKSFIKANRKDLLINVKSSFDGMTDCVERVAGGFVPAGPCEETYHENTLGVKGAWFVGQSRDYFYPYQEDGYQGIKVTNSCGSFILAINHFA
jgi:hypothetical protein